MAATLVGVSGPVYGTTDATPTAVAGTAAGDRAYILAVNKLSSTTPPTPAGWAQLGTAVVGTGADANSAGTLRVTAFFRDIPPGGVTLPAISTGGTGAVIGVGLAVYRPGVGETIQHAWTAASDTVDGVEFTPGGATNLGLAAGDLIVLFTGLTDNGRLLNSASLTATGATIGAVTKQFESNTGDGNDISTAAFTAAVTAGSATAAPVFTATSSSATGATGGYGLVRVRAANAVIAAAADFAGAGALSVTGAATRRVVATFAGAGQLVAAAAAVRPAVAAFAGAGQLTAGGTRVVPAAVSFAGAGALTATPGQLGSAAFAGAGELTTTARQTHQAAAGFAGAGEMAVAARSTQQITAAFTGSGALTVAGTPIRPAEAVLAGAGEMVTDGRRVHPTSWAAAGAGALFADGTRIRPAAAAFAGTGRMQVTGRVDRPGLNLSLWAVTGSGVLAPLPGFAQLEISRERNSVGSLSVEYPAAAPGFGHLRAAVDEDRPVEVEIWLGGSRDSTLRALITQAAGDDLDRRAVWRFGGAFLEQLLDRGIVYPQPAPAEKGELRFDAKNPGEVVLTVLQQAQARGALTDITRDWTTSEDSSGQPWPSTISGLKYSPKTTLLAILQDLVEKDFCEFEVTPDRVLRVWAPDRRGTDRTTGADPTLFRYGRVTSSPVRHSTRHTITAVLAVGADGLSATASDPSAEARLGGRIEVGVDAGNIDNQGALTSYAQAALAALTRGQEELRHPLTFGPGDPRPEAGYSLADRVLSERAGGVRRAVDVQQWTLTASRQRVTGGEVVLNDLIQSRLQRLQRQLDRLGSGGAVIGTSQPPDDDGLAPAAPTGVTVDSDAYTVGIDTYATLIVGWAPVITNSDGSAAEDIAGYRVEWRPTSDPTFGWRFGTDTTSTTASFGGVDSGVNVLVRVAAYDRDGNTSAWSEEVVILTEVDDTAPPAPSTPTAIPYLGQIKVGYDGLGSAGEAMPLDTDRIELEKSLSASFDTPDTAVVDTFSPNIPGERVLTDLDYGVTVYVRLVAVDRQGNRSAYSASASAIPGKVVSDDILAGAVGSAQLADLAVINAKIGLLAVNDANIGNLSVGKLTAGTLSVAVTNAGIVRSGTTGQRYELDAASLRFYNSAGSQTVQLNGSLNWILGELRTGLSGTRIVINPDGADPDEMRFYPTSGSFYARIETRTFNGQALVEFIGGTNRGDGATGQAGAHPLEGYIRWGLPESVTPYSVALCRQNEVEIYGPHLRIAMSERYSNGGAGTRRIQFEHRDSSGNTINASILYLQRNSSDQPWFASPNNNSGIYFGPSLVGVVQNGGNAANIVAADFVVGSSQELKDNVTDARALIKDALAAVRSMRPVTYKYAADRWRLPAPTEDDPNPEPVPVPEEEVPLRLGILAEEAPPILREPIVMADGTQTVGVPMVRQVNLLHQAIAQIGDQEIRSVAGRAQVPAGVYLGGREIDVPITWDETPLAVPTGGIVTVQAAVAWLGRSTARIVPGSITAAGCTVRVRVLTAVTPSVINPIVVEAQALYLFAPPYVPSEAS